MLLKQPLKSPDLLWPALVISKTVDHSVPASCAHTEAVAVPDILTTHMYDDGQSLLSSCTAALEPCKDGPNTRSKCVDSPHVYMMHTAWLRMGSRNSI